MSEQRGVADLEPLWRSKEQNAWYWYDWANSAFYTTILSVLFAPFMITVAGRAAGCGNSADDTCSRTVSLLGLHLAAGALPFYLTSFATISSAFVLPVVGAMVVVTMANQLSAFAEAVLIVQGAVFVVVVMLFRPEGLIPSARRAAEFHEGVHDEPLYDVQHGAPLSEPAT